jgi:hypothetical protein
MIESLWNRLKGTSKKLVRGLLWSNFDACWNIFKKDPKNVSNKVIVEIGKFCKRYRPTMVEDLERLIKIRGQSACCQSVLLLLDINSPFDGLDVCALIRAIKYNQDVPPRVLAGLCRDILRADDEALLNRVKTKLVRVLFPPDESDIVAYCGGVRLDIVPVWFLGFPRSDPPRNPFGWLSKISSLTESNRKILEYLLSLMVYLAASIPSAMRDRGVVEMTSSIISSASSVCRDNVAALVFAATRALRKCSLIGQAGVDPQAVHQICSIILGTIERIHPAVVRMTIDESYSITVGSALFDVAKRPQSESVRDPLVLKRSRISSGA